MPTPATGEFQLTEVRQLGILQFHQPLTIEWFLDEKDPTMAHVAYNTPYGTLWDRCPLKMEHNMHARGRETPEEIIKATAEFDLAHAFFHTNLDPNYGKLHWALWGALKEFAATWEDDGTTESEPAAGPQEVRRAYVRAAKQLHETHGICEIPDDATVTPDANGAFVTAKIRVPKHEVDFYPQCQAGPTHQITTGRPGIGTLNRC